MDNYKSGPSGGYGHRWSVLLAVIALALVTIIGVIGFRVQRSIAPGTEESSMEEPADAAEPKLNSEAVLDGLNHPWDIAFIPENTLIFTERSGSISKLVNGNKQVLLDVPGVRSIGEGGLMGLAVDPEYDNNPYVYACYNTKADIRVSRWTVDEDVSNMTEKSDIITGIPQTQSGRHSGCRLEFGADGYLWVGTGDAANGKHPQDPKSLGGKILKTDRNGEPALDNLDPPYDPLIFSYGHRNTQGLAMYEQQQEESYGYSVEHGPDINDEVNPLVPGNFGWDPVSSDGSGAYNESVPMTDKEKYPEAVESVWSSGEPTLAPSGATIITGENWGTYENALAMAVLKDRHLRLLIFDLAGDIKEEKILFDGNFGRIRSVVMGPDGNMYLSTDNGDGNDKIIKVSPS